MRSFLVDGETSAVVASGARDRCASAATLLHAAGDMLMEQLGPMFWAALLVMWVQAQLPGR
jgi:hypothetical protein